MFAAYLDDSGTHEGSQHYVVAGYLAPVDSWEQLSHDWNRALKRWDLEWFHMADAEGKAGGGAFKGWSAARRHRCIHAFARIVGRHARWGLLASLAYPAFKNKVRHRTSDVKGLQKIAGDPYTHAMMVTLGNIEFVCKEWGTPVSDVEVFFSKQSKGGRAITNLDWEIERLGIEEPRFHDPRQCPPLQAADMYAWRCYRSVCGDGTWSPARHRPLAKNMAQCVIGEDILADLGDSIQVVRGVYGL